ncbi:alcohol dehydrogenase catalytic domain-containing protein [Streptomyces sp. NPDC005774]|uniref:alcohol dehydrogenase catalytic domain-containing protein n=1 Tax=Streptomyces sp. NPDC005774 TaxID=3364728 RepID=UPI0036C0B0AF
MDQGRRVRTARSPRGEGQTARSGDFPRVQGGDIADVASETAEDVPDAWVGRRVLLDPAFYADARADAAPVGLLGSEADGGFASYVAVDAARVHDVSDSLLSDRELAALPVAYGTAMGTPERSRIGSGEGRCW